MSVVKDQRPRAVAIAIVLVTLVWLTGSETSGYRIATASSPSEFMLLARATGTLQGQVNLDGTACFWIGDTRNGEAISWPFGYSARGTAIASLFEPSIGGRSHLAVYNQAGQRVAQVGQRVVMAGGLMPSDVKSILGCAGFAQLWTAGNVRTGLT
jgi:hypothetical protein